MPQRDRQTETACLYKQELFLIHRYKLFLSYEEGLGTDEGLVSSLFGLYSASSGPDAETQELCSCTTTDIKEEEVSESVLWALSTAEDYIRAIKEEEEDFTYLLVLFTGLSTTKTYTY